VPKAGGRHERGPRFNAAQWAHRVVRVALLGAGRIGQLHGRLLAGQATVDDVVVWDIDHERAKRTADEIGCSAAPSLEEALRDADATVVAASTDAHAGLVRASVDRNLPTFCEKPLAFDLPETVALVDHIDRSGVAVQVGFQRRFDPAYREARRLVESGELGTVYLVRLIAHDHEPPPDAYIPISGGLFRDSSIHDFDALRWVTGQEVEEVYATGSVRGFPIFARYDDVDTAAAVLRLADGSLGVLSQTRHDPRGYDIRMEIVGSRDAVAVGLGQRTPLRSLERDAPAMPGPAWETFLTRFEEAYREELLAFVRVARAEAASPCTARDALQAMRISVAAGRSRTDGRPVRVMDA
jgi:myo-inositol 2-dehydrogenase/D-chiro-inositol 1-dehydrogenase